MFKLHFTISKLVHSLFDDADTSKCKVKGTFPGQWKQFWMNKLLAVT